MSEYQYIEQGKRLKKIREILKQSRSEWANELDLRENSYGDFERGRSNFSVQLLKFLLYKGININWLLSGEGEMLLYDSDVSNKHIENERLKNKILELEEQINAYKTLLKEVL